MHPAFCILHSVLVFPEGVRLVAVFAVAAAFSGLELQFLAFYADGGTGRDGVGDEYVGANHTFPADDGAAAQDGSTGVDGHMVLNGGVALLAP